MCPHTLYTLCNSLHHLPFQVVCGKREKGAMLKEEDEEERDTPLTP
jgi:hypothetical protein